MWEWLGPMTSLAGKAFDFMNAKSASNKARDQAQMAFPMRVKQAQKLGIHPLAALGANVSAGPQVPAFSNFGDMGQDVSRAVAAGSNVDQRMLQRLSVEKVLAEIDFIKARTASIQRDQVGPPVPSPTHVTGDSNMRPLIHGQGDSYGTPVLGPGWSQYPRSAVVTGPDNKVQHMKIGGWDLIRDPAKYSAPGGVIQQEGGEWIEGAAGVMSTFDSWVRAMERYNYLTRPQNSRDWVWQDVMRRARDAAWRRSRPWGE